MAPTINFPTSGGTAPGGGSFTATGDRQYTGSAITVQVTDELNNWYKTGSGTTNWSASFTGIPVGPELVMNVFENYLGNTQLATIRFKCTSP